jgi:hypothetical protein
VSETGQFSSRAALQRIAPYELAHVNHYLLSLFQNHYMLSEAAVYQFYPFLELRDQTRLLPKQTKDYHRREERESRRYSSQDDLGGAN